MTCPNCDAGEMAEYEEDDGTTLYYCEGCGHQETR